MIVYQQTSAGQSLCVEVMDGLQAEAPHGDDMQGGRKRSEHLPLVRIQLVTLSSERVDDKRRRRDDHREGYEVRIESEHVPVRIRQREERVDQQQLDDGDGQQSQSAPQRQRLAPDKSDNQQPHPVERPNPCQREQQKGHGFLPQPPVNDVRRPETVVEDRLKAQTDDCQDAPNDHQPGRRLRFQPMRRIPKAPVQVRGRIDRSCHKDEHTESVIYEDREIGSVNLRRKAQQMHGGQRQDSQPESSHRRAPQHEAAPDENRALRRPRRRQPNTRQP